jgi:hypothetical protein
MRQGVPKLGVKAWKTQGESGRKTETNFRPYPLSLFFFLIRFIKFKKILLWVLNKPANWFQSSGSTSGSSTAASRIGME